MFLTSLSFSQHIHPEVNFDYTNFCFGGQTHFYNTTVSSPPATYTWTVFQQGNPTPVFTSTITTNVIYQFPSKDTYTVLLCADNGGGHQDCILKVFQMDSLIHADFDYVDCNSQFTAYSTCANTYKWDFGDGTFSNLKNPSHYYDSVGSYNVKLKVGNGFQYDSITQSIFADTNIVSGNFSYKYLKDSVLFIAHDTLVGGNFQYQWLFGDGTSSTIFSFPGMKVKHKYPSIKKDSTYNVSLFVKALCASAYSQKGVLIIDSVLATSTTLFPNPISNGTIHLETDRKNELTAIKLYNSIGQEMTNFILIDKLRGYDIDISKFAEGPYILTLFFEDGSVKNYKIITHLNR